MNSKTVLQHRKAHTMKATCNVLTMIVLSLFITTAQAQVFVPPGLNPGDTYQLAFVTDGTRDATSTNIADYNAFVQGRAALNPTLTGTDMGVIYNAIASTASVAANVNALVEAPVYLFDGTKIADDFGDMWDGSLDSALVINQYGDSDGGFIWTGTTQSGASQPTFHLGASKAILGRGSKWIDETVGGSLFPNSNPDFTPSFRKFYALSEILTVPGGVPVNEAPTADPGSDQSIRAGDTVNLDGSASDDDNTIQTLLEYDWSFVSKPGASTATLDDDSLVMPSFTADVAGTYVLQLVVTDDEGLPSDAAFVEVSSDNLAPTAAATVDFSLAIIGNAVNFDGSGSTDPETDPLTHSWSMTAPNGSAAALVGDDTATPSLLTDIEGTYEVTLTVSDDLGPGTPATVSVVATTASGFAEIVIVDVNDQAAALTAGQVTTGGNQNAFGNFLAQAISNIQAGDTAGAIDKLNKAIARTDGCALRGSPDGNGQGRDWVTECDAQLVIYDLLTLAVEALED